MENFDMAQMMQMLQENPELAQMAQSMGLGNRAGGGRKSKKELVKQQEKKRREVMESAKSDMHIANMTNSMNVKPSHLTPGSLDSLAPIRIHELQINTTHRGRYLRGTLLSVPVPFTSVICLIEDDFGEALIVAFYNAVPDGLSYKEKIRYADRHFKAGRKMAIIDPYFKVATDGSHVIRVDNYADVVDIPDLYPTTLDGWKDEGTKLFKMNHTHGADASYTQGIRQAAKDTVIYAVLLNMSYSHLQLGEFQLALYFAAAAITADQSLPKGYYRASQALFKMNHPLAKPLKKLSEKMTVTMTGTELTQLAEVMMDMKIVESVTVKDMEGTPESLKQRANELFKNEEYQLAIDVYRSALLKLDVVSKLLGNRAACCLQQEFFERGFMEGLSSIAVSPGYSKGLLRQVRALIGLKREKDAALLCEKSLNVYPQETAFQDIRRSLAVETPQSPASNPSARFVGERKMHAMEKEKYMSAS